MKTIVLYRADTDNAGNFSDAGTKLTIGDKAESGFITADRAKALVASGGAASATAAAADAKVADEATERQDAVASEADPAAEAPAGGKRST